MKWRSRKQFTVGGLLVLVATSALVMSLLRPPDPPDEGEAIRLAKEHFSASNEFDYPKGYWVRAEWSHKLRVWRVGFYGAGGKGSTLLAQVSGDRSCRTPPMDYAFFDVR